MEIPSRIVITSIEYEMVYIKPGSFMKGIPPEENPSFPEMLHKVTLTKGFYIGVTVVTQRQWYEIMGTKPWQSTNRPATPPDGDNYPAMWINWNQFSEFISELNKKN